MVAAELMKLAETERDHEEWIGQLWLCMDEVLRDINTRIPPPYAHTRLQRRRLAGLLKVWFRRLRQRVAREGTPHGHARVEYLGNMNSLPPNRVVRRF